MTNKDTEVLLEVVKNQQFILETLKELNKWAEERDKMWRELFNKLEMQWEK